MDENGTFAQSLPTGLGTGRELRPIDSKNRITVPAGWNIRSCEEEIFAFPRENPDRPSYLALIPKGELARIVENAEADPRMSPAKVTQFKRHFVSLGIRCPIDKQGRLLLPKVYVGTMGLEGEVQMVGYDSRVEIWHPSAFEEQQQAHLAEISELAGELGF